MRTVEWRARVHPLSTQMLLCRKQDGPGDQLLTYSCLAKLPICTSVRATLPWYVYGLDCLEVMGLRHYFTIQQTKKSHQGYYFGRMAGLKHCAASLPVKNIPPETLLKLPQSA